MGVGLVIRINKIGPAWLWYSTCENEMIPEPSEGSVYRRTKRVIFDRNNIDLC